MAIIYKPLDDVALVVGPAPSLGAPSVPIVIDGSESEHATSDSDSLDSSLFLNEPGTAAEVPAAAASGDEIEQLRRQAAAAAHSYRVARAAELRRSYREARAAAATKAIYQAARRKPEPETIYQAIAQGGSTTAAEVPAAAASGDEIEQLRRQAAAAAHSYRVARAAELRRSYREARAAAATKAIYQAARRKPEPETIYQAIAQGGSTADDVAETGSADDVALVVGPAPSLGAPSVPIVIDGSGSEHATSDSDSLDSSLFLNEPGTAAEVPAAAASGDEIEQLRRQAAAAAHSYRVARAAELRRSYREARAAAPAPSLGAPSAPREGGRAAAATEAIYQAGIAPPADAQVGSTADNAESRDEVEPLRLHEAAAIRACRARCEARREAIIQAVDPSNIPMCGVKYPNPRRNPLKRRKLE